MGMYQRYLPEIIEGNTMDRDETARYNQRASEKLKRETEQGEIASFALPVLLGFLFQEP